jgi:hypothetical protein
VIEEDGHAQFVGVHRAVSLGVVGVGDVHLARAKLRVGDGHELIATLDQRRHQAGLAGEDGVIGHVAECDTYKLVDEIRIPRAQVVGEVRGDRFLAGAAMDLVRERFRDACFLAVTVGVGVPYSWVS